MSGVAENIDPNILESYESLRRQGSEAMADFAVKETKKLDPLQTVAWLAEAQRIEEYYEAISEARRQGCSWRKITAAANGKTDTRASQDLSRTYYSYCKNNGIEAVKTR